MPDPRQQNGPDDPVDTASDDDGDAHEAVEVVGQSLVDTVAVGGRDERRDGEVNVGEQEEDGDG